MTINKKFKGVKLQCDIDRKAAKMSVLSSGKIDKYEYLTAEKVLPSGRYQLIQQAKFTYLPLGKAFEKQINTIKEHEDKQINAIMNQNRQLNLLKNYEEILFLNRKEIFNKLVVERFNEILKLNDEINFDNLAYHYKNGKR